MIDYEKVEQAKKLLDESGAQFVLAYDRGGKHCSIGVNGEYATIRNLIITAMWEAIIKDVYSMHGGKKATNETIGITKVILGRLRDMERGFK